MAPYYGVPVIMHSDHCAKNLLPWFDGMLEADEAYFAQFGEPLFSSHMLDLSEEPDEENIAICVQYFKRMGKIFIEPFCRIFLFHVFCLTRHLYHFLVQLP
jgi:fructose-bisphosphate aldolase class II